MALRAMVIELRGEVAALSVPSEAHGDYTSIAGKVKELSEQFKEVGASRIDSPPGIAQSCRPSSNSNGNGNGNGDWLHNIPPKEHLHI